MVKNPKYQIFTGKDGKFYFRLNAKNGQQILSSQGYADKGGCKNGIESVRTNGPLDERYEIKESANGKHYFNLLAANKQVIGNSQMYSSADACKTGIDSVKANADSPVEDETLAG